MTPTRAARGKTMSASATVARAPSALLSACSPWLTDRTSAPSSRSNRTNAVPRKPSPPVTATAAPCQVVVSGLAIAHRTLLRPEPMGARGLLAQQQLLGLLELLVGEPPAVVQLAELGKPVA